MNKLFSYGIDCALAADSELADLFKEFSDNGAEFLVMNHPWCRRILTENGFISMLKSAVDVAGLKFLDAHAPYGCDWDLNAPESSNRDDVFSKHKELMRILSEFGIKTYVIHIGNSYDSENLEQIYKLSCESLRELLPTAEKCGITICLENIQHINNSPPILLRLLNDFKSDSLGFCYDAGHAWVMESMRSATPDDQRVKEFWGNNLSDDILDIFKNYIVTCNLHDNKGVYDSHNMPGEGTVDWGKIIRGLNACPRLQSFQSEVHFLEFKQSATELCKAFDKLKEEIKL